MGQMPQRSYGLTQSAPAAMQECTTPETIRPPGRICFVGGGILLQGLLTIKALVLGYNTGLTVMANIMTASELLKGAKKELSFSVLTFPHLIGAIQGWEPWTVGIYILTIHECQFACLRAERIHIKRGLRETRVIPLKTLDLPGVIVSALKKGTMSSDMLNHIRMNYRRPSDVKQDLGWERPPLRRWGINNRPEQVFKLLRIIAEKAR